jgi:hypothetical protein
MLFLGSPRADAAVRDEGRGPAIVFVAAVIMTTARENLLLALIYNTRPYVYSRQSYFNQRAIGTDLFVSEIVFV